MTADRELRAEVEVSAPIERVWAVLTDFKNMAAASSELVTMLPLLPGGLRTGQQYLGINKRKFVVWPTRNVVVDVSEPARLAWDTKGSGARWIYELEPTATGTKLTQRRPVPEKLTVSGRLFSQTLLGGAESHTDELEQSMRATLEHLKQVAESQ